MNNPLSLAILIAIFGICQFPRNAFAQAESTENVTALTLFTPGLSYEKSTSRSQSLRLHAYMSPSFSFAYSSSLGTESKFWLDPAIDLQYRFYYNFRKRLEKKARVEKNSANFIAIETGTYFSKKQVSDNYFEEASRRPVNHLALLWGLQRNMPGRFSLNFSAGAGFSWTRSTTQLPTGEKATITSNRFILPVDMGIGIWLGKLR
ncbi:MAG: hypothetical protein J7578_02975 [Chitinophagaceae bacterium]|nr:hypothetical protein [Chitinophagaceae bacterium]